MYTDNIHRKWSLKFLSNYIIIQLLVVLIVIANWKKKVMLGTNGGNNYTKPNPTVFNTLT